MIPAGLRRSLPSVGLAGVVGTVYIITAARSVGFIDSGELATVAWTLGIPHPTGYPFFTLLGWIVSHLPLGLPVITTLNFFSAVTSAGTVVLFFHFLRWLLGETPVSRTGGRVNRKNPGKEQANGRKWEISLCALFGALVLAFSETFWSGATVIEVYPLHGLFLVLLLFLFLKIFYHGSGQTARSPVAQLPETARPDQQMAGMLFAYVLGLSFTNHLTTLYLAPAFLFYYFRCSGAGRSSRKFLLRLIMPFLLGLSVYLYLPVRAAAGAVVNWGNPSSLETFVRHLSGKQYSVWIFSSLDTAGKQLKYFFNTYGEEFWYLPLVLALIGLHLLWKRDRTLSGFFLLLFAGCLVFAVNYDIHDIDSYFLLAYVSTAALAAFGLYRIFRLLKPRRVRIAAAAVALGFTGGLAAHNFEAADQHDLAIVEEYTKSILDATEKEGMVISYQWDYFVSASYYYQLVEGYRPDVVVIDKELLRRSWYLTYLERRYPGLTSGIRGTLDPYLRELYKFENDLPYDPQVIERRYTELIGDIIGKHYPAAPVYVTPEIQIAYTGGYARVPHGLTFRLFTPGEEETWEDVELALDNPPPVTRLLDGITMLRAQAELNNAIYLVQQGRPDDAIRFVERALAARPDYAEARALMARLGRPGAPQ